MKRKLLFLLFVLCLNGMTAQVLPPVEARDYRAVLDISGRIDEISVSPNGSLFLTNSFGEVYYTSNIDSIWHTMKVTRGNDFLDRISFFNADTAILTGYIQSNNHEKSGYYITYDGGRTWKIGDLGQDGWFYAVSTDDDGHAWLGTAKKTLLYSEDFGGSFKKLEVPFKSSDRIYTLHMADNQHGMVGSDDNEILITENNWQSAQNIPTPFDQKKVVNRTHHSALEIGKVTLWGDYLLVQQGGRSFYAKQDEIEWQPFPVQLMDFELAPDHHQLLGYDDSLRLWAFTSPTQYRLLTEERLPAYPENIKVMKGSLYLLLEDYRVCRADPNGLVCRTLYTTDHSIKDPSVGIAGKTLLWGIKGGDIYKNEKNHLYLAEIKDYRWFREAVLDFTPKELRLLNDETAVLWDGLQNHLYSLRQHKAEVYQPAEPLHDFLASPITKMTIEDGEGGAHYFYRTTIEYTTEGDLLMATSVKKEEQDEEQDSAIVRSVSYPQFISLLNKMNADFYKIPEIQDFNITKTDIQHYQEAVENRSKKAWYSHYSILEVDRGLYDSIPLIVEDINPSVLYKILAEDPSEGCTAVGWFEVTLVNAKGETCLIRNSDELAASPWMLPWHIIYNGQHYSCCDLPFSNFIKNCLTSDFRCYKYFDNAILLMEIADYFQKKRR